jgi:hypothetical protein
MAWKRREKEKGKKKRNEMVEVSLFAKLFSELLIWNVGDE